MVLSPKRSVLILSAQGGCPHPGVVPEVFANRAGHVLMTAGTKGHTGVRAWSSWPGLKGPGAYVMTQSLGPGAAGPECC